MIIKTSCLSAIAIGAAVLTTIPVKSQTAIAPKEFEEQLATMMKQASGQRRASLTYNETLARVARERAQDMARRGYFSHVNPDGLGANYLVRQAGYVLPDSYGKKKSSNNIESIASGNKTPADAWAAWMGSSAHKKHLLGLTTDYAEQTDYGIGYVYVPESQWKHYWVVITAKRGEPGKSKK
jgi:uncharacterized protein YkwD